MLNRNMAGIGFLAFIAFVCLSPARLFSQQQPISDEQLREQVLNAIERGQQYLIDKQARNGTWTPGNFAAYSDGVNSLATLALLNSGLSPDHPNVDAALSYLENPRVDPNKTYEIAMVIMALAAGDRAPGKIGRLAARLERIQERDGFWGYGDLGGGDNSNTQFAVLGLREAVYAGASVDREVWERVQNHFMKAQTGSVDNPNGAGWAYTEGGSAYGSMTVAGLASLIITQEMLQDDSDVDAQGRIDCCGADDSEVQKAIDAGVRWLSSHFQVRSNPGESGWLLYYLYGLERAGRFSGRRFFGDHDWYREGARFLVDRQSPRDGFWISETQRNEIVGTSFALLFLSKGLSPVLINKIKYGPRDQQTRDVAGRAWNQHQRDANNLTTYISQRDQWPKLMSWQVVDLRAAANGDGVASLLQSPVQLLTGSEDLDTIQGRELELLRQYILQGGFIFAVNSCQSAEFHDGFRDLVKRLFDDQYQLYRLPETHDVYRSEELFDNNPPELWGVDVGCRTAIMYSEFDHACRWNKWTLSDSRDRLPQIKSQIDKSMKLGVNVIAYATGRELQDKLRTPQLLTASDLNEMNRGRMTIARLQHTGGWDTAPNALRRLQSALETVGIDSAPQMPNLRANDLAIFEYPMIYMHGRKNFFLSEEETDGLRAYLENGGFLFADACCGAAEFDESFRRMIEQIFGEPLSRIPSGHEIYNLQTGYDLRRVNRRIPPNGQGGSILNVRDTVGEAVLEGVQINGKYVVVYSKYDISCALERQSTPACAGYSTEDAAKIGVNLVLYGLFQ
ncbi:DUF4159 domain-containing protein [Thalassoglobus sp. JC818]|uniref:DUF4159 domain-containing protein n=1 Tax=Thalassoglobus sp. JC818 TaxID=3232136 RepID=UPI00345B3A02